VLDSIVGEVNDNDAKVAMKGWATAVTRDSGMEIDYRSQVISSSEEIVNQIRSRSVDSFAITPTEYRQVGALVDPAILVDEYYAQGGEEYLVLVHEDSGIRDLSGLRGHSLVALRNPRMSLAVPWLETALASANAGPADGFFSRRITQTKLAKAVLPIYFHRVDAGLVSRRGFQTMCELNPQLGTKLRAVAVSPKLIPMFMGFHRDSAPARKKRFMGVMLGLANTVSGRQAMLLFESVRLAAADTSLLHSSVDLLTSYDRARNSRR
jgi:phosphonate transport system substrate-binding protein